MDKLAFWYSMGVDIGPRATKYTYGTIEATNSYKALDELELRCLEEHGGEMRECRLHPIDKTTGEKDPEPCLIVTPGDGKNESTSEYQAETSQACEKSTDSKGEGAFGAGWARELANPNPVVPLKHKEG
jgi:hypothetical protein